MVATIVRSIFEQPSAEEVRAQHAHVVAARAPLPGRCPHARRRRRGDPRLRWPDAQQERAQLSPLLFDLSSVSRPQLAFFALPAPHGHCRGE